MTKSISRKTDSESEESLESLRVKAKSLSLFGIDRMSRDELLYEVLKAEGGDGGLGI